MNSDTDTAEAVGFPIRESPDQSLFADSPEAYRKLLRPSSPLIALGIHRMRLFA